MQVDLLEETTTTTTTTKIEIGGTQTRTEIKTREVEIQLSTAQGLNEQQERDTETITTTTTTTATKTGDTTNRENKGRDKTRIESEAKETILRAERDKKMSDYCNLIGNVLVILALLAYIIVAWVEYADRSQNRKTIVTFKETTEMKFPSLFFECTEFGTLEQVDMVIYKESCSVTGTGASKTNFTVKHLYNPTSDELKQYKKEWVLANTSLSYYSYSGYGYSSSSGSRRLSSVYNYYDINYTEQYYDYFSNYSYENDYYTSSTSNIYYVYPPDDYTIAPNQDDTCGDIYRLHLLVSVPYSAFTSLNLTNFTQNLYVRSYPDSFGFAYGWGEKAVVQKAYNNKGHVYFSGRLPFGELRSEELQYSFFDDHVDNQFLEFYGSLATLDYTNIATNSSYHAHGKVYFNCYLYIYGQDFAVTYETTKANKWYDVISAIGGMYGTLSSPIGFLIAAWLYGIAVGCLKFEGRAPLDPLPDDLTKRLDGYIANKILIGELAPGNEWKGVPSDE